MAIYTVIWTVPRRMRCGRPSSICIPPYIPPISYIPPLSSIPRSPISPDLLYPPISSGVAVVAAGSVISSGGIVPSPMRNESNQPIMRSV
jgi:hypothetical protein